MREVRKEPIPSQVFDAADKDSLAVHVGNGAPLCGEECKLGSSRSRSRGKTARGKARVVLGNGEKAAQDCDHTGPASTSANHFRKETKLDARIQKETAVLASISEPALNSGKDALNDAVLLKATENGNTLCQICRKGEKLLCCGDCKLFCHRECIGLKADFVPGPKWLCPDCRY